MEVTLQNDLNVQSGRKETIKDNLTAKPKDDPKDGKRPIVLSGCLIIDILCCLLSFSLFFLLENSAEPASFPKTDVGEEVVEVVRIATYYGIVSTAICFVAAMLLLIYTLVVMFGEKRYEWLGGEIGKELALDFLRQSKVHWHSEQVMNYGTIKHIINL